MSAEAMVEGIITNAKDLSNEKADDATRFAEEAQTAAITVTTLPDPTLIGYYEPDNPGFDFRTDQDLSGDYARRMAESLAAFGADFLAKFNDFIATYFPNELGCLRDEVDAWLCETIQNGGQGLPLAVEQAIVARGADRAAATYVAQSQLAAEAWAARGFSLPSGILLNLQEQADKAYRDDVAQLNRDTAIRQAELNLDTLKFAIEKAISLRLSAIDAAINYVKLQAEAINSAIRDASEYVNAHKILWGQAVQYFEALIRLSALRTEVDKANAENTLRNNTNFVALVNGNTNARVHAAISAANAMGEIAAAALGAQNTLAHIGNTTTTTKKG